MVPRRARFIWHGGEHAPAPPPPLRPWLDDDPGPSAPAVLLIPDSRAAWDDVPLPPREQRWAAGLVTRDVELGTATRATGLGADDVLVLAEDERMLAARLRRLAATAVLRRETGRRRRLAGAFASGRGPLPRRGREGSPAVRPAILFVGPAGGDQLQVVNALGGWHVAAYAETLEQAIRHLAGGEFRAVVVTGVTDPSALGALFGCITDAGSPVGPSVVLLRPEAAAYGAVQAMTAGADDVIAPGDPQDLVHQRLMRAVDDATRRAELRANLGFERAIDPVSGLLGYSAFHAYVADRLAEADVARSLVLVVEVDGLDQVNRHQGFAAGDRALARAARAIASRLRAEDLIGRVGGAAFAIWLDHADADALTAVAQRLREAVRRATSADAADGLTARVGWTAPESGAADAAMVTREARAQARGHARRAVG